MSQGSFAATESRAVESRSMTSSGKIGSYLFDDGITENILMNMDHVPAKVTPRVSEGRGSDCPVGRFPAPSSPTHHSPKVQQDSQVSQSTISPFGKTSSPTAGDMLKTLGKGLIAKKKYDVIADYMEVRVDDSLTAKQTAATVDDAAKNHLKWANSLRQAPREKKKRII